MSPQAQRALRNLARLANQLEPRTRDAFQRALAKLQLAADVEAAASALATGDVEGALKALMPNDATAVFSHELTVAVARIVAEVGPQTAREIAAIVRVDFHFIPGSRAAADALDQMVTTGVLPVLDGARAGLRSVLRDGSVDIFRTGLLDGTTPRDVARDARAFIGLTEYDKTIIDSFDAQLRTDPAAALTRDLRDRRFDATLAKAADGTPLTESQVAAMRGRYVERLQGWRSETWARTVSLDAVKVSNAAAWQQAADSLGIEESRIIRRWVTAHDERVRPEHAEMDGATAPMGQPYSNGQDYPGQGDFGCRCVEVVALLAA